MNYNKTPLRENHLITAGGIKKIFFSLRKKKFWSLTKRKDCADAFASLQLFLCLKCKQKLIKMFPFQAYFFSFNVIYHR